MKIKFKFKFKFLDARETSKVSNNEQIRDRDSIHTTREKVENAALFLRLGLLFTLIRYEH